jgi:GT2 family glycosyltransferase
MKLSVIIVNYNVKHFLEQCLKSVFKSLVNIDGEVFVVDNNSVDGSVEMVKKKFPQVNLIANNKNTGFSRANNQAIKLSKGEYVLLLNPDTVVQEDTFKKCISFMDDTADAGGLGVQMIDGKGRYLPESKRGLPTPAVAFYKITGLSKLFPTSKTFGRYHQGFLPKNKTHRIDVLAGAFMMLRKSVLDKIGLLDEDYFMYGEDIDLSYRITKAGYNNYYFPDTRIIHYKGESTKKSSANYVIVFYRAMIIFAKKHFSSKNAGLFSMLINMAIYLKAASTIIHGFIKKTILPFTDGLLFFGGMYFLTQYWEVAVKELNYPPLFIYLIVPLYVVVWITAIFFSGGYDRPLKISKSIRGIATGTILILIVYALLSEEYRFSRALILIGTIWSVFAATGLRLVLDLFKIKGFALAKNESKKLVIVGSPGESRRILTIIQHAGLPVNFVGYADASGLDAVVDDDEYNNFRLGREEDLAEIVEVYDVGEIIFCAKDVSSQEIINQMLFLTRPGLEFKIAPPESPFIIGSNFLDDHGDVYLMDIKVINTPSNRRNKRIFDVMMSIVLLITFPVGAVVSGSIFQFIKNIFGVLFAKYTWVTFAGSDISANENAFQPVIKRGILTPADGLLVPVDNPGTVSRLNVLYAKDYHIEKDLKIILRSLKDLGRKPI